MNLGILETWCVGPQFLAVFHFVRVKLDDGRGVNYAADNTVIGIELLSPARKGVNLAGLPYADEVARVMNAAGFRVAEYA